MDMLIYHVEGAEDRQRFFERLPARRKADAVIVIAMPVPDEEAERLDLMGVQVVVAGGQFRDYPHVRIDDVEVARQAVNHLVATRPQADRDDSHRADPEGASGATTRPHPRLRAAMESAGCQSHAELMVTVPWGTDGGARAMDRSAEQSRNPRRPSSPTPTRWRWAPCAVCAGPTSPCPT